MTIIRPNSISGVTSITGSAGDISIFRADGTTADLNVNNITSGIITATHYGSGANLTSLPAGNLTGTLPAISGANLTGITQAVKKIYSKRDGARHAVTNLVQNNAYTSMWNWNNMVQTITPQSNTSQFHITGSLNISHGGSYEGFVCLTYQHSGLSGETAVVSNSQTDIRRTLRGNLYADSSSTMMSPVPLDLIVAPATTNAVTFRIRLGTYSSGYPWYVNRDGANTTNNSDGGGVLSSWTITELDGSQVTLNQTDVILDT